MAKGSGNTRTVSSNNASATRTLNNAAATNTTTSVSVATNASVVSINTINDVNDIMDKYKNLYNMPENQRGIFKDKFESVLNTYIQDQEKKISEKAQKLSRNNKNGYKAIERGSRQLMNEEKWYRDKYASFIRKRQN